MAFAWARWRDLMKNLVKRSLEASLYKPIVAEFGSNGVELVEFE
jgi:hypothetical protein